MKMKTIHLLLISLLFVGVSCKKKKNNPLIKNSKKTEKVISNLTKGEEIEDCEDFLEQYEDWAEDYARFMEKYKDNPGQAYGNQEFIKMLSSATTWTTEWATIVTSCAANPSYEKRMEKITEKMEEKMKELGF